MKSQNLLKITALSCVLLLGSSVAVAAEDCTGGYLTGLILTDVIIPAGGSCVIEKAIIHGNIEASGAVDVFVDARVSGSIWIQDGQLAQIYSTHVSNEIVVLRNEVASVVGSTAPNNIVVNTNSFASVKHVQAGGDLLCRHNERLESTPRNFAAGENDCGIF
jgi:hypothetical protein